MRNIKISQPIVDKQTQCNVVDVLASGQITEGPVSKELEKQISSYTGSKHTIVVNSGTAALHCAINSLGLKKGDAVITSPFTFVASVNAILFEGANVIFADIELDDFNISPDSVNSKITSETKAILPIDLYGHPADYKKLRQFNLPIIEDACQSIGASINDKKTGTLGDIAAFSMYATKNIFSAEGGFITTDSDELAKKCSIFKNHGQNPEKRYEYISLGYNYRLSDVLASIALPQIGQIDTITEKRNRNAALYQKSLSDIKGIVLPKTKKNVKHAFHQYTIRVTEECPVDRQTLATKLQEKGISTGIYYPQPLHYYPCFKSFGYKPGDFPRAELAATQVLSLPVHQNLSDDDIFYVIENISDTINEKK